MSGRLSGQDTNWDRTLKIKPVRYTRNERLDFLRSIAFEKSADPELWSTDDQRAHMNRIYLVSLADCRLANKLWDYRCKCPRSNLKTDEVLQMLPIRAVVRLADSIRLHYPKAHPPPRIYKLNLVAQYVLDILEGKNAYI
jgi:hypothetical protein